MIGSLQLFDMVWILTGGGPANATTTMATFLITEGTKRYNYGIATAASVILFAVGARAGPALPGASSCAATSRSRMPDRGGSDEPARGHATRRADRPCGGRVAGSGPYRGGSPLV